MSRASPVVVVIEDDPNKLRQLSDLITETLGSVRIVARGSFQSGLKEILTAEQDLVCLDMTLPTYDEKAGQSGGRTRFYGGRTILREAERNGKRVPIVVVTQFESFGQGTEAMTLAQLRIQLETDASPNYIGTVFYHAGESGWRRELAEYVRKAIGKVSP